MGGLNLHEFLAETCHELRGALTTLRAPLRMLAADMIDPGSRQGHEMLEIASEAAERMTRLVNDVLDFERLSTGRLPMYRGPVTAGALLRQAANAMRPLADERAVRLHVAAGEEQVEADRERIQQVLTNLIENALAYSPQGEAIGLSAEPRAREVVFTVRDHGPGVPAELREAIFERYRQGRDARVRGAGLGLAIARQIVEQHGGRIWVEPAAGGGSAFSFTLPRGMNRVEVPDDARPGNDRPRDGRSPGGEPGAAQATTRRRAGSRAGRTATRG